MKIKPLELANLCSLFISLRAETLYDKDLLMYLKKIQLIDSISTPNEIIEYASNFNLIKKIGNNYCITNAGKSLGRSQNKPDYILKEKSKKILIKQCFLNLNISEYNCKNLIVLFEPNSFFETFVYKRTYSEPIEIVNWIKILDNVNLLYSEKEHVLIRKEHLNSINIFIKGIRNQKFDLDNEIKENERNIIGDTAEEITINYEVKRLKRKGYPELSKLVQRISKIDTSAGYDIISYQGQGKHPENKRLIEVKGTQRSSVQFIWSRNERSVATLEKKNYWIYCYTNVDIRNKKASGPFCINNPIIKLSKLNFKEEPIDILYQEN